jgi:C_GCAxxG_C_C family probable redox protein
MLSKEETLLRVSRHAHDGFLCSEAVLLALSEYLDVSNELIPRIATGFGLGVGRSGEVCGAIAGGLMGLGIRFGRTNVESDEERRPYWYATLLLNRFREDFGELRCGKLLGLDLSNPEEVQEYHKKEYWDTKCRSYIRAVTASAYDILKENSSRMK